MGTYRLLLVRHAKAADPDESGDHGRSLTSRGARDADALGDLLAARDLAPALVLCSDARRAVQTWEHAAARLAAAPPCRQDARLYEASVDQVLDVVAGATGDAASLAVVGHEPTTSATARALAGPRSWAAALEQLEAGLPTASVAVLEADRPWRQVEAGAAALVAVHVPRG